MRPALGRLGLGSRETEDARLDRELRGDLIRTLGILGDDPETQAMAREVEALSRTGTVAIDASVAAAAIEVVAFAGGADDVRGVPSRGCEEAPTPQEQDRYRYALARFRDPASDGAARSRSPRPGRSGPRTRRSCCRVPRRTGTSAAIAWRYVRDHWDELLPRFAASNVIHLAQGAR